jgi:hypothetical protein
LYFYRRDKKVVGVFVRFSCVTASGEVQRRIEYGTSTCRAQTKLGGSEISSNMLHRVAVVRLELCRCGDSITEFLPNLRWSALSASSRVYCKDFF